MTGSSGTPSSGSGATTGRPRRRGGAEIAGGQGGGLAGEDPQGVGADGELQPGAECSAGSHVHLGPERYRTIRVGASETVQQAGRVERRNRAGEHEREADRKQVERLEREIAGVEARLKETYDRVRIAIDERIRQARRAIRAGSEAVGRGRRSAWKSRCGNWPGNTRGSSRSWPGRSKL